MSLIKERSILEARLTDLNYEKREVESLLNTELKPKVAVLKKTLAEYRRAIEIQNEATVIGEFETSVKTELFNVQMEDDSQLEFKIKNQFNNNILGPLDDHLSNILELCMYERFSSALANVITFTQDTEHGRYGFLHGVR